MPRTTDTIASRSSTLQLSLCARHVRLCAQRLVAVGHLRPPTQFTVALTSRIADSMSVARVRLEREAIAVWVDLPRDKHDEQQHDVAQHAQQCTPHHPKRDPNWTTLLSVRSGSQARANSQWAKEQQEAEGSNRVPNDERCWCVLLG